MQRSIRSGGAESFSLIDGRYRVLPEDGIAIAIAMVRRAGARDRERRDRENVDERLLRWLEVERIMLNEENEAEGATIGGEGEGAYSTDKGCAMISLIPRNTRAYDSLINPSN